MVAILDRDENFTPRREIPVFLHRDEKFPSRRSIPIAEINPRREGKTCRREENTGFVPSRRKIPIATEKHHREGVFCVARLSGLGSTPGHHPQGIPPGDPRGGAPPIPRGIPLVPPQGIPRGTPPGGSPPGDSRWQRRRHSGADPRIPPQDPPQDTLGGW